jgi:hypothetical protein
MLTRVRRSPSGGEDYQESTAEGLRRIVPTLAGFVVFDPPKRGQMATKHGEETSENRLFSCARTANDVAPIVLQGSCSGRAPVHALPPPITAVARAGRASFLLKR